MISALKAAETAVTQLTEQDLARFREWFAEYDANLWDAHLEADAAAGKLDALAQEALEEYHAGNTTAFESVSSIAPWAFRCRKAFSGSGSAHMPSTIVSLGNSEA